MKAARIASFVLSGALLTAPALFATETKKVEAKETKTTQHVEQKKVTSVHVETQAEMQKSAKISMTKAREIALKKVPGTVKTAELEREHGKLIYSIDVQNRKGITEVNVDAMNGSVIGTHHESAAKEAAEKKQDMKGMKH
jgi:uncharacterized membrane protein YkoI